MKAREDKELLNVDLPKWPQLIVTGKSVSKDRALEIIRRTDVFFRHGIGGNNSEFNEWVINTVNFPELDDYKYKNDDDFNSAFDAYTDALNTWHDNWNYVTTEYVANSWISCSELGGPCGFMHQDGQIGYDRNIGKWPSVEEVFNDFKVIAEAFPDLDMEATIMNGEECEYPTRALVSFKIKDGKATLVDPEVIDVHEGRKPAPLYKLSIMQQLMNPNSENAISKSIISKWAEKIK